MIPKMTIKGHLTKWQANILNKLKRFNIIRSGRRSGKTYLSTYAMLKYAVTHPNTLSWFVALDISTCVELAIPEFERMCPPEIIASKNKQTRTIVLINGSVISWKTMESADALRGRGIDFLVLEEAAFAKNGWQLWQDVLSPQLMGRGGRAIFISSPNGSNWFRRLEMQVKAEIDNNATSEWAIFLGTIFDAGNITPAEIEQKRIITPELTWRQEYLAEYVDEIGLVYWEYSPKLNTVITQPSLQEIYTIRGLDWGMADNTACVWLKAFHNGTAYVADEYVANNFDAIEQAHRILAYNTMPVKYSVLDSSCWNRDPSMSSVAKRFGNNGLPCMQATRDFDSSVSDTKGLIASGKILINEKCVNLLRAIEGWQHGSHEPDILAAFRYGVSALVKNGKLMPPIRTAKPFNIMDYVKQREKEAYESERALNAIMRGKPQNNQPSFKIYNNYGK